MKPLHQLVILLAALALLVISPAVRAATAAGASIELDGNGIAGYTITHGNESRQKLYDDLPSYDLTFERDYKIPVEQKNPALGTLKGVIRIYTRIAGERQLMASATTLQLVKKDGKWRVSRESLDRALKVSAPAQAQPGADKAAPVLRVWDDGMTKRTAYLLNEKGLERLKKLLSRKPDHATKSPIGLAPTGTISFEGQTYAVEEDKIVLATRQNATFWFEKGIRAELIKLSDPQPQPDTRRGPARKRGKK